MPERSGKSNYSADPDKTGVLGKLDNVTLGLDGVPLTQKNKHSTSSAKSVGLWNRNFTTYFVIYVLIRPIPVVRSTDRGFPETPCSIRERITDTWVERGRGQRTSRLIFLIGIVAIRKKGRARDPIEGTGAMLLECLPVKVGGEVATTGPENDDVTPESGKSEFPGRHDPGDVDPLGHQAIGDGHFLREFRMQEPNDLPHVLGEPPLGLGTGQIRPRIGKSGGDRLGRDVKLRIQGELRRFLVDLPEIMGCRGPNSRG